MREALSWDGPAIVECVVDEHEPPLPARVRTQQAKKLFEALREGTPNRNRLALQIIKDTLDESSFKAAPTPAHGIVPRPIARAASAIVERVIKPRGNGHRNS